MHTQSSSLDCWGGKSWYLSGVNGRNDKNDCRSKLIFVAALKVTACNIMLVHNHPSGNFKPSRQDEELTHKIKEGGKLLDIQLLDHLIISNEGYFSKTDEGLI